LNILQGTFEIAGQMGLLAGALKRRGHLVTAYNCFHSYLGYHEHLINVTRDQLAQMFRYVEDSFDLYHFHYFSTFTSDYSDLYRLKEKGKKVIMHHWGDDVRQLAWARRNNPYVNTHGAFSDDFIHERLARLAPYMDAAIVQDAEVLSYVTPYYRQSHVLPITIDLRKFPYTPPANLREPLIVHAPTNPVFKGTSFIENTLEMLRREFSFRYVRVEGMSHEEAANVYRSADLVIDQVLCGSYGLFSTEAMALGKPVVCYIREDLVGTFPPELPIVSANPDTLYDTLRYLLQNPEVMANHGARGRAYAEQYHDVNVVGAKLLAIYETVMQ